MEVIHYARKDRKFCPFLMPVNGYSESARCLGKECVAYIMNPFEDNGVIREIGRCSLSFLGEMARNKVG